MSKVFKLIGIIFLIIVLAVLGLLGYLMITEYNPKDVENSEAISSSTDTKQLNIGDSISVLTYNIGYCNDSSDSDFFMDGGKRTRIESKEKVQRNLKGIEDNVNKENSDIVFIQEADISSKRGYGINEVESMAKSFGGSTFFAKNFSCKYIPYPFPDMIGGIESGIMTSNNYQVDESKRYALPVSFSFPVRLCQMKRCLLTEKIKIKGTDKYLVLVNLHLEAYDDGEGKVKQTKVLTSLIKKEYEKGNYVIAGGDFNQVLPGVDESKYPIKSTKYFMPGKIEKNILPEGWQYVTDDSTPTSRLLNEEYDKTSNKTQYYVIDGFILSPNVKLKNVKTINTEFNYSDHNPVKINVELQGENK